MLAITRPRSLTLLLLLAMLKAAINRYAAHHIEQSNIACSLGYRTDY